MTLAQVVAVSLGLLMSVAGCRKDDRKVSSADAAMLANRETQLARRLAARDLAPGAPLAMWILPRELREISGLALTANGQLLAHNDQRAVVFVINPRRGIVVKRFSVGEKHGTRGDFEAITVAQNSMYLLTSNGKLYQFKEGADGATVRATLHDTRLGRECEFEGLAFDPRSSVLLLPCKNVETKKLRDQLVIYRYHLGASASPQMSMLTIPLERVIGPNDWKRLHPTDIAVDPVTGNYVLIAGPEQALIEVTPTGELVRSMTIPGRHPQAEGVAVSRDSIIAIADEATKGAAMITLYRWPIGTAAPSSQ
ncbi:MAG: hypothetical protein WKF55_03070 [Gemmatimonadaceae bacterium]